MNIILHGSLNIFLQSWSTITSFINLYIMEEEPKNVHVLTVVVCLCTPNLESVKDCLYLPKTHLKLESTRVFCL